MKFLATLSRLIDDIATSNGQLSALLIDANFYFRFPTPFFSLLLLFDPFSTDADRHDCLRKIHKQPTVLLDEQARRIDKLAQFLCED